LLKKGAAGGLKGKEKDGGKKGKDVISYF